MRLDHTKNTVLYRFHSIRRRLGSLFLASLIIRTVQEMSEDDATHMAASVAYYTLFSLFPLMLGLIALLSLFLDPYDIQIRLTDFAVDYLPGSEALVEDNINAIFRLRGVLGIMAIVGLLWSGSAIFGAVNRAVNRAWDVHKDRPFLVSKPRQLAMALGVGVLFFLSLATASFVQVTDRLGDAGIPGQGFLVDIVGRLLLQGASFLLTLGIFLLVYKLMPNTKTYWRYIWPGALFAAVMFEIAKNGFILYLNRFSSLESLYGSLAPVIVLLLWAYISALILILGAELSSEYGRLRRGLKRGVLIHPTNPHS